MTVSPQLAARIVSHSSTVDTTSRRAQAAARRGRVNQVKKHALKRGLNHGVEPTDGREEEDETPKINLGAPSKTLKGGARSAKNALQVRDTYIH